jgi:DNA-binding NtrC family response regulator
MKDLGILIVDDDTAFSSGMEKYLKAQGCLRIRTAYSGEGAIEMVHQETPGVVLLDLYLPGMNGLKVLREMLRVDHRINVVLLTCEEDEEYRKLAAKLGAFDYLTKPITMERLFSYLETRLNAA